MKVTEAWLLNNKACLGQVDTFKDEWPDGVEVSEESLCRAAALSLDLDWLARNLLSPPALNAYNAATVPALNAYNAAKAHARNAYVAATDPALNAKDYYAATDPALNAYSEATAPARNAYGEATAPALWEAFKDDRRNSNAEV